MLQRSQNAVRACKQPEVEPERQQWR